MELKEKGSITLITLAVIAVVSLGIGTFVFNQVSTSTKNPESLAVDSGQREVAVLAGGCFWCTEAFFQEEPGVVDAVSGYAGGQEETADYKSVSSGKTEHKEAVKVIFDPAQISYEEILDVYWAHIDPTDVGGQFADRGPQYKTAIFYYNDRQRQIAEDSKARLAASNLFTEPIAVEILPFTTFFEAEEYHQDYYKKAAGHYERYKKASGRADFVEDNWAKEAALLYLEEKGLEVEKNTSSNESPMWTPRNYTDEEIVEMQKKLDKNTYHIIAENGTEPAYKNEYYASKEVGIYVDVVTGDPLFSSTHKYDSGTGWPSFYKTIEGSPVTEHVDTSYGMVRTEVRSIGGHLGHLFSDGPKEYGGNRYCINSASLKFVPKGEMATAGYGDYLYLFN